MIREMLLRDASGCPPSGNDECGHSVKSGSSSESEPWSCRATQRFHSWGASQRNEHTCPHRSLGTSIHSSTVRRGQQVETTMSVL